jgi:hypothetical protein
MEEISRRALLSNFLARSVAPEGLALRRADGGSELDADLHQSRVVGLPTF